MAMWEDLAFRSTSAVSSVSTYVEIPTCASDEEKRSACRYSTDHHIRKLHVELFSSARSHACTATDCAVRMS